MKYVLSKNSVVKPMNNAAKKLKVLGIICVNLAFENLLIIEEFREFNGGISLLITKCLTNS